jgi:hypothetical protein
MAALPCSPTANMDAASSTTAVLRVFSRKTACGVEQQERSSCQLLVKVAVCMHEEDTADAGLQTGM